MTCRAAGQHLFAADLMIDPELFAFRLVDIAVLPLHVIYLTLRTDEFLRLAVTRQTPLHLQRVLLEDRRHIVDLPVTCRAADTLCYVNAVIEICVLRQVVNAFPLDGLILAKTLANDLEVRAVRPDLAMAVHTGLGRRHPRRRRRLDRLVAIAAIDAIVTNVMFMAKLDRLLFFHVAASEV